MIGGKDDFSDRIEQRREIGSGDTTEIAPGVTAPASALHLQFARGGGPGGQNVNKLNTKAELWVDVARLVGMTHAAKSRLRALAGRRLTQSDQIHLASESQRSQHANRQDVFDRLREMIIRATVEPTPRRKTRPTRAAKHRRLEQKRRRAQLKSRRRPDHRQDD